MKSGDKTADFIVAHVVILKEEEHDEPRGLAHFK